MQKKAKAEMTCPPGSGAENDPLNWKKQFVVKPVGGSDICVFIDYQFN